MPNSKSPAANSINKEKRMIQLIVFRITDEEFAIPISEVREIIKVGPITPIPDSPNFIKGIINVRGDIVSIIDLRERFLLPAAPGDIKHIVITKQNDNLFGLLVNEVKEVIRIDSEEINTPPPVTKINKEYIRGIAPYEGRLIILIDLAQILSQQELIRLSKLSYLHKDQREPNNLNAPE